MRPALVDLRGERLEALLRTVRRNLRQRRNHGIVERGRAKCGNQRRDVSPQILVLGHHLDFARVGKRQSCQ